MNGSLKLCTLRPRPKLPPFQTLHFRARLCIVKNPNLTRGFGCNINIKNVLCIVVYSFAEIKSYMENTLKYTLKSTQEETINKTIHTLHAGLVMLRA